MWRLKFEGFYAYQIEKGSRRTPLCEGGNDKKKDKKSLGQEGTEKFGQNGSASIKHRSHYENDSRILENLALNKLFASLKSWDIGMKKTEKVLKS